MPISPSRSPAIISKRPGIFDDMDSAVTAATRAQEQWVRSPVETREKVIEAMRQCTRDHVNDLSRMAVEETKLGNVADKVKKNLLCANKTPGALPVKPASPARAWVGAEAPASHAAATSSRFAFTSSASSIR